MKRLRLLKVVVQPIFVIDDGESLAEYAADPVVVSPGDWPTFATTAFVLGFEKLRLQIEGGQESTDLREFDGGRQRDD